MFDEHESIYVVKICDEWNDGPVHNADTTPPF